MCNVRKVLFICIIMCLCFSACDKKTDKTTKAKEKNQFLSSKVTFTIPKSHVEYYQQIESEAGVSLTGDKTNGDGSVTYTTTTKNKEKLIKEIKKEFDGIKETEELSKFEHDNNFDKFAIYYNDKKKTFTSDDEWLLKIIITTADIYHCITGDNKKAECKAYDNSNNVLKAINSDYVKQDFNKEDIEYKISNVNNFTTEIWNDVFCDVDHYITDGTNSTGEKFDINKTMKKLDKHLATKKENDKFINSLENDKYKKIKTKWIEISKEIDTLSNKLKKESPKPNSNYDFNTDKFNDLMYEFSDLISTL